MNYVVYNADFGGFNLSQELMEWMHEQGSEYIDKDEDGFYIDYDIPRHDPLLVKGVQKFLADGARPGGRFSMLDLAEIEGDRYIIEDYDGREIVTEPNEIEWIVIR